jgi:MFS transporter, SP family, general alpha glucoside:H+ symporter
MLIFSSPNSPEPSGRTFAELDLLFERGVSARKFKDTKVDVFEEAVEGGAIKEYEDKIVQKA